jgi:hypothetical protein
MYKRHGVVEYRRVVYYINLIRGTLGAKLEQFIVSPLNLSVVIHAKGDVVMIAMVVPCMGVGMGNMVHLDGGWVGSIRGGNINRERFWHVRKGVMGVARMGM